MALSAKAQKTLIAGLASKAAALELQVLVAARAGKASPDLQRRIVDTCGRGSGALIIASLTSGATLPASAQKRLLIMMAGDTLATGGPHAIGNELINYIQTAPQTKPQTL